MLLCRPTICASPAGDVPNGLRDVQRAAMTAGAQMNGFLDNEPRPRRVQARVLGVNDLAAPAQEECKEGVSNVQLTLVLLVVNHGDGALIR